MRRTSLFLTAIVSFGFPTASRAQPAGAIAYLVHAEPVTVTHTERFRGAHKPPVPPELRPGREVTRLGMEGKINEITEGIRGFKVSSEFKVGEETYKIWVPDSPTTVSSAPPGRFDSLFDGAASVTIEISATGAVSGQNVVLRPQSNLGANSYSFKGVASTSAQFQNEFKARVEAQVKSILGDLEKPVTLSADHLKELNKAGGGSASRLRSISFFEDSK